MRKTTIFLLSSLGLLAAAMAGDLPRHSYPFAELEEAKAYALEKEKPLIFVDT